MEAIVCRVNTDEGVSGYGEASVGFDTGASASYSMIKEVAPFVIGMDNGYRGCME